MARITVWTCDNCEATIPEGEVTGVLGMHWCQACVRFEARPLHLLEFMAWPRLVLRTDVRAYLEWRDGRDGSKAKQLADAQRDLARSIAEVERLRQQAAEGYANGDMAKALSDIATNARRARDGVTA